MRNLVQFHRISFYFSPSFSFAGYRLVNDDWYNRKFIIHDLSLHNKKKVLVEVNLSKILSRNQCSGMYDV